MFYELLNKIGNIFMKDTGTEDIERETFECGKHYELRGLKYDG